MDIYGRNLVTGLPSEITVSGEDVYDALNEEVSNRLLQDGDIKRVPMDIVTAFYLGAISNVGMRWLANSKYTKEELLNYLDKLLPDTIYLEK